LEAKSLPATSRRKQRTPSVAERLSSQRHIRGGPAPLQTAEEATEATEATVATAASPAPAPLAPPAELTVNTERGLVRGQHYPVPGATGGVILAADIAPEASDTLFATLAQRLQAEGIPALRLAYRKPGYFNDSVHDVLAALIGLEHQGLRRFALIGAGFGASVAITAGVESNAVAGVAAVAALAGNTDDIDRLAPTPLLLIHGSDDTVSPSRVAQQLFARAREPKELVIIPGAGHDIAADGARAAEAIAKLAQWSRAVLEADAAASGG
jgi:alpha/beta superfamily hydrolase